MKKILFILLFFLLTPSVFATDILDRSRETGYGDAGNGNGWLWTATKITPTNSGNVNKISIELKYTSSPTGTLYVELLNDSSGEPGTTICQVGSLSASVLTGSFVWYDFTNTNTDCPVTASSSYWIAYGTDLSGGYVAWNNDGTQDERYTFSSDHTGWANHGNGFNYRQYYTSGGSPTETPTPTNTPTPTSTPIPPTPTPIMINGHVIVDNLTPYPTTIPIPSIVPVPTGGYWHEICSAVTDTSSDDPNLVMVNMSPSMIYNNISNRYFPNIIKISPDLYDIFYNNNLRVDGMRLMGSVVMYQPESVFSVITASFNIGGNTYYTNHTIIPPYHQRSGYLTSYDETNLWNLDITDILSSDGSLINDIHVGWGSLYDYVGAKISDLSLCLGYKDENSSGAVSNLPTQDNGIPNDEALFPTSCDSRDPLCNFKMWINKVFIPDFSSQGSLSNEVAKIKTTITTRFPLGYIFFIINYDWDSVLTYVPEPEDSQITYNIPIIGVSDPPPTIPIDVDFAPPVGKARDLVSWARDLMGFFLIIPFMGGIIDLAFKTFRFTDEMKGTDDTVGYNEWQNKTHIRDSRDDG